MQSLKTKSWSGVQRLHLDLTLPEYLPLLRTVPLETMSVDNILYYLSTGALQLWAYGLFETILITEIVHHPKYSVLVLKFGAGKITPEIIRGGRDVVVPWAKTYGCTKVEVVGRKGWGRLFNLRPLPPSFIGDL